MIKKTVFLLVILTLSGCVGVDDKPIVTETGRQGYSVTCNGSHYSFGDCAERAGQLCPKGYTILSKDQDSGAVGSYNAALGTGFIGSHHGRSMVIQCK